MAGFEVFTEDVARPLDPLDGLLNYCRTTVRFAVVEAINGKIKAPLRRGRG